LDSQKKVVSYGENWISMLHLDIFDHLHPDLVEARDVDPFHHRYLILQLGIAREKRLPDRQDNVGFGSICTSSQMDMNLRQFNLGMASLIGLCPGE
jgi:hypothetical protein